MSASHQSVASRAARPPGSDDEAAGEQRSRAGAREYRPSLLFLRVKALAFRLMPFVARAYAFNRLSRDAWVAKHARALAPGSRVIDVGAGACPYRGQFRHCRYVAHDFGRLEPHQLQGGAEYGELHLVSDITRIPAETGTFDAALCTEVIEHVPEPIIALAELGRLLRPGGVLLLSAPLRSGLHQLPYHYYGGFTPAFYERFLAAAGFEQIEVTPLYGEFRFYGEESVRACLYLSPFGPLSGARKALLLPVWLVLLPWLAVVCPLLFAALDRLDDVQACTAGYFVRAVKSGAAL